MFGFVQDNKQLNVKGIGLGLVISKLIVEKFNGEIQFTSDEGKGCCFDFTFKLSEVNAEDNKESIDKLELVYSW
jgi:K+-sensing histidine kinase KdpD